MLDIITGPMFSGKSQELIRRVRRLGHAVPSVSVSVYKPERDTRDESVKTHYGDSIECLPLYTLNIEEPMPGDWIALDEFQFAGNEWATYIMGMVKNGVNIIAAGLVLDSRGQPFGPMAKILVYADNITSLTAICKRCGEEATKTQRLKDGGGKVLVGGDDLYEARCMDCWEPR